MVEEYFGFSGPPFKLSPDTRFFFGSKSHNKAMAYLHYGLRQSEGFIVITGEIGAGKSMLIEHMLDQVNRENIVAATLLTASVQPEDLIAHILSAFQIEASGEGNSAVYEAFEDFLYDNMNHGRRVLLVVDEAQNLPTRTIEELRMLTNINHQGTSLFQVFLVGQPEFRGVVARQNMEQLRQRVIASYHLDALDGEETREYIEHRLAVVGGVDNPQFTEEAFEAIYQLTVGIPRRINTLCTRLLLFCSLEERNLINSAIVNKVAQELQEEMLPVLGIMTTPPQKNADIELVDTNNSNTNNTDIGFDEETSDRDEPVSGDGDDHDDTHDVLTLKQADAEILETVDDKTAYSDEATLTDVREALAALNDSENLVSVDIPSHNDDHTEAVSDGSDMSETLENEAEVDKSYDQIKDDALDDDKTSPSSTSVMDQVLGLRKDLHTAHHGNRDIHAAITDFEDRQQGNVIEIEQHLKRASDILSRLESKK